jgi:hypothetical protein
MDQLSLPQDDPSIAEWLLTTNFQEPDALDGFDFTGMENVDFPWPQEASNAIATENNTTV